MRAAVIAAAMMLLATAARADSWAGPVTREVFSQSREYFVRVVPGESLGDTVGFASARKGRYARAELYRRGEDRSYRLAAETTLLNPVAPVEFFVSDAGQLATLDNWHNTGYGKVAAFYDPAGRLLRAYELRELFAAAEVEKFPHSVSSIRWRKGPAYVRPDQKTLLVTVRPGADFVFALDSGGYRYCEPAGKTFKCR
jgi:hypothetical protein